MANGGRDVKGVEFTASGVAPAELCRDMESAGDAEIAEKKGRKERSEGDGEVFVMLCWWGRGKRRIYHREHRGRRDFGVGVWT